MSVLAAAGCSSSSSSSAPKDPGDAAPTPQAAGATSKARTDHEKRVASRQGEADYRKAYDARMAELGPTTPTAEQCRRLVPPPSYSACDPTLPGCAAPPDSLGPAPAEAPIANGCAVPKEAYASSDETPAGMVGVREPYATALEGCDDAFVSWLYRTCP